VVAELMPDDGGKLRIVLHGVQHAGGDADGVVLAGEGVDLVGALHADAELAARAEISAAEGVR
jgi:hypothetical protein